jgi:hypothetical protein
VSSSTATFVTIAGNGAASTTSVSGTDKLQWSLNNSGSTYHLNGLGGGLTPAATIVGGSVGDTSYPNANSSIAGNGPHNPFAQGEGIFTLAIAGVTSSTQVTNVVFSFGTTAGDNVDDELIPLVPTPETGTFTLLLAGAMLMGLVYGGKRLVAQE